jgi:hypothetical protein
MRELLIPALGSLYFLLTSCTLSSQCVCTHGVASDVVDETLKTDATPTTTVNASFTPTMPRLTGSVGPK